MMLARLSSRWTAGTGRSGPRSLLLPLGALPLLLADWSSGPLGMLEAWLLRGVCAAFGVALVLVGMRLVWVRRTSKDRLLPPVVGTVTLGGLVVVGLLGLPNELAWRLDFERNLPGRMAVVGMVQREELRRAEGFHPGHRAVPEGFRHLSRTGTVLVRRGSGGPVVFFYYQQGMLGDGRGFLYWAEDAPFTSWTELDGPAIRGATPLREHWYWTGYVEF